MIARAVLAWVLGIFLVYLVDGQEPRYSVALTIKKSAVLDNVKQNNWDKEVIYWEVMKHLKSRCRFVDPSMARLVVIVSYKISQTKDSWFPKDVIWCNASLSIAVIDRKKHENYAFQQGESGAIFHPILRKARRRAIATAASKVVPKLIQDMDQRQREIYEFELRAIRIDANTKELLVSLLGKISGARLGSIQSKSGYSFYTTISYPKGILEFRKVFLDLWKKESQDKQNLPPLICDIDGLDVVVHPIESAVKKFQGEIMLFPDQGSLKKLKIPYIEKEHQMLEIKLKEYLQQSCHIYNLSQMRKKMILDARITNSSAIAEPTDLLLKEASMVSHIIYYWVQIQLFNIPNSYCVAKAGLRMIRTVDGEELANFQIKSKKFLIVQNIEESKEQAISQLAREAGESIIEKLLKDDPQKFQVDVPQVRIYADGLVSEDIKKIASIIEALENEKEIKIQGKQLNIGKGYLEAYISFPERPDKTRHTQISFRQRLLEDCEDEGLSIHLQSKQGEIIISPLEEKESSSY